MPIIPARLGGSPAADTLRARRPAALDKRTGAVATHLPPRRETEEEAARWREEELGAAAEEEARAAMEAEMVMDAMVDLTGFVGEEGTCVWGLSVDVTNERLVVLRGALKEGRRRGASTRL